VSFAKIHNFLLARFLRRSHQPKAEKKKGVEVDSQKVTEILATHENKSTFESERILAWEFNEPIKTHDRVKPQQDESVRIEVTFSKEQFAILQQAQSLLSDICPEGGWSAVLTALAEKYNQTQLGKRTPPATQSGTEAEVATEAEVELRSKSSNSNHRPYISAKIKRRLLAKAQYECEFVDSLSGKRCSSKHQLQMDHRWPLALGGNHSETNLRILCRRHNLFEAKRHGLERPSPGMAARKHPF
jgi:hypothetical protein